MAARAVDDGVLVVVLKCVAFVVGVGDGLRLRAAGSVLVVAGEGENGDDAVVLVWEEAAGVVYVDDDATREDILPLLGREQRDRLVLPRVPVFTRRMAPMLISRVSSSKVECHIWQPMRLGFATQRKLSTRQAYP